MPGWKCFVKVSESGGAGNSQMKLTTRKSHDLEAVWGSGLVGTSFLHRPSNASLTARVRVYATEGRVRQLSVPVICPRSRPSTALTQASGKNLELRQAELPGGAAKTPSASSGISAAHDRVPCPTAPPVRSSRVIGPHSPSDPTPSSPELGPLTLCPGPQLPGARSPLTLRPGLGLLRLQPRAPSPLARPSRSAAAEAA